MKKFTLLIVIVLSVFQVYSQKSSIEKEKELTPIINYEDMDQVKELALDKPTVLFFKANWCPSCIKASKNFEKNIKDLEGVYLVVVNYDTSKKLQKEYGVTYQHTFVQVSPEGEVLAKWNGGDVDKLLEKIVIEEM